MNCVAELTACASDSDTGEVWECRNPFGLNVEGINLRGEGKKPMTSDRPETMRKLEAKKCENVKTILV